MTFTEALHAAQDTDDPTAYIDRVKRVVQSELQELDATSRVESTPFFNHTAVPDFVVTWPGEARRHNAPRREVFLRHSYRSIEEERDETYLAETGAIVMALRPRSGPDQLPDRPTSVTRSHLLVTDSEAVELVGAEGRQGDASPIGELVRANFVRGARGHIDPPAVSRLLALDSAADDESVTASRLIAASFAEDAAARINRTAQLIELALSGTPGDSAELVGGKLSIAELQHLLPWLLTRPQGSVRGEFWSYIGTLFGFKELESIRENLLELDLTPLVTANANRWGAKRAYVGLAVDPDGAETAEQPSRPWGFHTGSLSALSVDLDNRRLYLAQGGTLLKARPSTSAAAWDRVRDSVRGMRLRRVDLRGIRRSVSINAEQSPDVQGDVDEVTRSLDDSYFVDEITLRFPAPGDADGHADVDVQFDEGLAVAEAEASIADLARTALSVLNYRDPATPEQIDRLLGL